MITAHNRMWWILGLLAAIALIGRALVIWTDYLWMDSLGQAPVFLKLFWVKAALGLLVGVLYCGWLWFNLRLARRKPPEDVTLIGKRLLPEEDRAQIEKYADRALLVFCVLGGVFAAAGAARQALPWLMYTHAVPFGQADPIFQHDFGFYVFQLPILQYLYRSLMALVVVALVASTLVHLYQENIRVVGNTIHATPWARRHLLSLFAAALLLKVLGYRLAMYDLLYSTRGGVFTGAAYSDVHARLPMLWMMMLAAVAAAVVIVLTIPRRDFKRAGWALGGLLVLSFLGGTAYPAAIQRLVVVPNQLAKEKPYIDINIAATRQAYGLDQVDRKPYAVSDQVDTAKLRQARATLKSIRLWDYRPLEAVYDMKQALRSYYGFPGVDVDRYVVNNELRQVSLSARQLDYSPQRMPQSWVNQHLIYTHGYGAVVSPVNETDPSGLPLFWVNDLPPRSEVPSMDLTRSQVYFQSSPLPPLVELVSSPESLGVPEGQVQTPAAAPGSGGQAPPPPPAHRVSPLAKTPARGLPYVLVNTNQPELDYSSATGEAGSAAGSTGNAYHRYAGPGGVKLSSFWRKVAFAVRFRDLQILLSQDVKADSRIQLNRYLPEGLAPVAPFLLYDPDPYLVIVGGQLKWICDAYTVTDRYPYSARADRLPTEPMNLPAFNYLRNSVKVVVDAYEGIPTFYAFDSQDPILRSFRSIFPTLFTDAGQMPPDLRRHVRVPLLQFMVQARVYGAYHISDSTTFYNQEDWWTIPPEIYAQSRRMLEPYYVVMALPGQDKEQFVLMMPYVLFRREERVAVAWMGAVCDEPDYGRLVVYDFPKGEGVMGPLQFEGLVDQQPEISGQFTLWSQSGSRIIRGNTLMIPIDGIILYVEPVYLVATEDNAVPQLVRVIVAHGNRIVMEPTLDRALSTLFGVELKLSETGYVAAPETIPATAAAQPPTAALAPVLGSDAKALLNQALQLGTESEQALRAGDLAGYQAKRRQQDEVLRKLQQVMAGR